MYDYTTTFFNENQVLIITYVIGGLISWYGIFKGTFIPLLVSSVVMAILLMTASFFLHMYCRFSGTDIDTVTSYDYPMGAAIFTWSIICIIVAIRLDKLQPTEKQEQEYLDSNVVPIHLGKKPTNPRKK